MRCKKCGYVLEEGLCFCPWCGQDQAEPVKQPDEIIEQTIKQTDSGRKKRIRRLGIALFCVFLIALGAGGTLLLQKVHSDQDTGFDDKPLTQLPYWEDEGIAGESVIGGQLSLEDGNTAEVFSMNERLNQEETLIYCASGTKPSSKVYEIMILNQGTMFTVPVDYTLEELAAREETDIIRECHQIQEAMKDEYQKKQSAGVVLEGRDQELWEEIIVWATLCRASVPQPYVYYVKRNDDGDIFPVLYLLSFDNDEELIKMLVRMRQMGNNSYDRFYHFAANFSWQIHTNPLDSMIYMNQTKYFQMTDIMAPIRYSPSGKSGWLGGSNESVKYTLLLRIDEPYDYPVLCDEATMENPSRDELDQLTDYENFLRNYGIDGLN